MGCHFQDHRISRHLVFVLRSRSIFFFADIAVKYVARTFQAAIQLPFDMHTPCRVSLAHLSPRNTLRYYAGGKCVSFDWNFSSLSWRLSFTFVVTNVCNQIYIIKFTVIFYQRNNNAKRVVSLGKFKLRKINNLSLHSYIFWILFIFYSQI